MRGKRIFVALSGGVDSSVAAARLVEQGFDVTGVYMKYASERLAGHVDVVRCSWEEDWSYVEAVGSRLSIPVRSINIEREYDRTVIGPFISAYAAGRTPNPDVLCNREIKFGIFLNWALAQGADAIATGHYAQLSKVGGQNRLQRGRDPEKDQSYFLSEVPVESLNRAMFPIGQMLKKEVRSFARNKQLPNAERPDSQGVCFVGRLRVRDFLRSQIQDQSGQIVTTDGHVIGTHAGLSIFTIGQRHGLGVSGSYPYFVVDKNLERNELVVAAGLNHPALLNAGLIASQLNLIESYSQSHSVGCLVQVRYRQAPVRGLLIRNPKQSLIIFEQPVRAVAPGQIVVLYDHQTVIGSGVIESGLKISEMSTQKVYENF